MRKYLLILLAFLATAPLAFAQIGGTSDDEEEDYTLLADARVKATLDKLELKYEIVSEGKFKLLFQLDSGRSQIVLINSKTYTYSNFEIREIWSPAMKSSSPFSAKVGNKLLESSYDQMLGAWQTYKLGDTYLATFAVKIAASTSAKDLEAAIRIVVNASDAMEKDLTGKDEY